MWGGVWGMRLWQHCLYGWVSCVHAGGGWLAGWLPEKLVGMQGHGWGRRLFFFFFPLFTSKLMFVSVYLEASSKFNSDNNTPFLTFEETAGCLENCLETGGNWLRQAMPHLPSLHPPLETFPLPPSIAPSPTPVCCWIHTGSLFSPIFYFLSRAFVWVTVTGVFNQPPSLVL